MVKINYLLNGSLINPPKNWQETRLQLNFDRDGENAGGGVVSLKDLNFVRENARGLKNIINQPTAGGVGIFEGIPLEIQIQENTTIETALKGYIDLTDDALFSCEETNVKVKEEQSIEWLNDVADSFTFEYLESIGTLSRDDFKFIPYVTNNIPDYRGLAIGFLSIFVISEQVKQAVVELTKIAASLANPFEATAIIRAILYVAYLVILLATLVKLAIDLINSLIQRVKYHACMNVGKLLQIGASHLGLTVDTEILTDTNLKKLTIMSEKYSNLDDDNNKLFGWVTPNKAVQNGYFNGTYGDLLREVKKMLNAKLMVQNGVIKIIRRDKKIGNPAFQMPNIRVEEFKTNASELKSNYHIAFMTDLSDKNTIQRYTGTAYQVITEPITVANDKFRLMKGYERVQINLALAKRKEKLTAIEQIFNVFLKIFDTLVNAVIKTINVLINLVNKLIKVVNKVIKALKVVNINIKFQIKPLKNIQPVTIGKLIENRIGMMEIETDFTSVQRIFLLDEGNSNRTNKIATNNATYLTARGLWERHHFVNSFVPTSIKPKANQYLIKQIENVPFCLEDYNKVKTNNLVTMPDGNVAEIFSLDWNPFEQNANFVVKIPYLYSSNLTQKYLEPNGQ